MRMKGEYMGAGAEASASKSEVLAYYAVILVIIGVLAFAVYTVIKRAVDPVTNAAKRLSGQDAVDLIVRSTGQTPSAQTTANYWDATSQWLGSGELQRLAVQSGNVLLTAPVVDQLGRPLLTQASLSGQAFRQDLLKNEDLARLESDPLKSLIVTGEGLSRTFTGFSPYNAGVATKQWITSVIPGWG